MYSIYTQSDSRAEALAALKDANEYLRYAQSLIICELPDFVELSVDCAIAELERVRDVLRQRSR
jgi:hypothetical protein